MLSPRGQFSRRDPTVPLIRPNREPKSAPDPAVCPACHAVRLQRTWSQDAAVRREVQRRGFPADVLCPACRQAREHAPLGFLHAGGTFARVHRDEILRLVKNVETAAMVRNPLERVLRVAQRDPGRLVFETTSEKLARRLGRALHRAYHGRMEVHPSHADPLVHIYWHRDLDEETP